MWVLKKVGHASPIGSRPGENYVHHETSLFEEEEYKSVMMSRHAKEDQHMVIIR
jgi:hypothetical protein